MSLFPDQQFRSPSPRDRWDDGQQLIKDAWAAFFAALFQLGLVAFFVSILKAILDAPPADTHLDRLIKFAIFLGLAWAVWNLAGAALTNLGNALHDRALGRYLLEKKTGGWRQAITVGLTIAVVTVYFNHHPDQLDSLVALGQQLIREAQAWFESL